MLTLGMTGTLPNATMLEALDTPTLLLDAERLDRNLARLSTRLAALGVPLRPHVKTAKSLPVIARALVGQPGGVTVSTLQEAEECFRAGITDILYAVGISPQKVPRVAAMRARGADVTVIVDSLEMALVMRAQGEIPALIEIDTDGHRAGVAPQSPILLDIGRTLGAQLRGVLTHAGESYQCKTLEAKRAMAERERAGAVHAAERLREGGLPCDIVSVGSTPTAMFADNLAGITEVRAGVHMFMDLVMAGLGVCEPADIAISVLTTVIGHQAEKGWILTDAGWMAMSRDRGTATQDVDQGYGMVCDLEAQPIEGLVVSGANQEHGIIACRTGVAVDPSRFPIGSRLRILPNHACATAAQYDAYHVVAGDGTVYARWPRFGGW